MGIGYPWVNWDVKQRFLTSGIPDWGLWGVQCGETLQQLFWQCFFILEVTMGLASEAVFNDLEGCALCAWTDVKEQNSPLLQEYFTRDVPGWKYNQQRTPILLVARFFSIFSFWGFCFVASQPWVWGVWETWLILKNLQYPNIDVASDSCLLWQFNSGLVSCYLGFTTCSISCGAALCCAGLTRERD